MLLLPSFNMVDPYAIIYSISATFLLPGKLPTPNNYAARAKSSFATVRPPLPGLGLPLPNAG